MSNNSLIISSNPISQDADGRYCLNDLHKAAGNEAKHQPALWLRLDQTKALIEEINHSTDMYSEKNKHSSEMRTAIEVINGGNNRGTYVVKELVYAYAMWISPSFHLKVIRAYDTLHYPNQGLDSSQLHTLQSENAHLQSQTSQLQQKYIGLLEDKVAWLEQQTQAKPKRAKSSSVSDAEVLTILRLHAQGLSGAAIAKQIGRSPASVSWIVRGAKGGAA